MLQMYAKTEGAGGVDSWRLKKQGKKGMKERKRRV